MTPAVDELRWPDDTARPDSDADLRAAIHARPLPPDQRRRPGVAPGAARPVTATPARTRSRKEHPMSNDRDRDPLELYEAQVRFLNARFKMCGLNADWCVSAWHIGPGCPPNTVSGDAYLLDEEDGDWALVRRWYRDDVEIVAGTLDEDVNDRIDQIAYWSTADFKDVIKRHGIVLRSHLLALALSGTTVTHNAKKEMPNGYRVEVNFGLYTGPGTVVGFHEERGADVDLEVKP